METSGFAVWPTISVVTPSYNQGQFIEETIRSVLLQGYPSVELIIIDGGSADETINIIKKYERWISYWVSEKDSGQSEALNKGFEKATGDWIGWQNSDDVYGCNAFSSAALSALGSKADVLHGKTHILTSGGMVHGSICTERFTIADAFPFFKISNQSILFSRRIFDEGHRINLAYRHAMDYEFFWQLILAGYKLAYAPGFEATFREHELAKSSTQAIIKAEEDLKIYQIPLDYPHAPPGARELAVLAIQGLCIDNFGKLRLKHFRESFYELIRRDVLSGLQPDLLLRYCLSFAGIRIVRQLLERTRFIRTGRVHGT